MASQRVRRRRWEQRLDGVRRVDLYQQGRSMLDFQLELRGERPTLVARQLLALPRSAVKVESSVRRVVGTIDHV